MNRDVQALKGDLEAQGFTVTLKPGGHYKVERDGAVVGVLPATPSDWRNLRNTIAALRRNAGYRPPRRNPRPKKKNRNRRRAS